jgi:hypothetical protein
MATAELTTMPATIEQLLFVIDLDQRFMPLLLAYGLHFMTDAHTYSGRRHESKACFNNCGSIMVSHPERNLRYAEGYAVLANAPPLPFRHAWLVDADGVVRDPTLRAAKPAIEYFGIIFTTDYYMKWRSERTNLAYSNGTKIRCGT